MAENSKIEWTDATWNPITGCSVVSPGCTHCYAMRLAGTRLAHHPSRQGLTQDTAAGPVWNGQVRLNEAWLAQPMHWRRPRMIFVCAHGDLFHEAVPLGWIDKVFTVMALCPQHTFQVLTKRAGQMRQYLFEDHLRPRLSVARRVNLLRGIGSGDPDAEMPWPLPNVWLGVSAEDQRRADERVPDLLHTPAAVRFVSAEPLLGPLSFRWAPWDDWTDEDGRQRDTVDHLDGLRRLNWIIVGGESGPRARVMDSQWARDLQAECAEAGVAFFMKQMTGRAPIPADLMVRQFPVALAQADPDDGQPSEQQEWQDFDKDC